MSSKSRRRWQHQLLLKRRVKILTDRPIRKRARYDSGEELIDPSDMFANGFGGGGAGGLNIDPSIIINMMNGMGGGGGGGAGSGHGFHQFPHHQGPGASPFGGHASFGGASPFGGAGGGPFRSVC